MIYHVPQIVKNVKPKRTIPNALLAIGIVTIYNLSFPIRVN